MKKLLAVLFAVFCVSCCVFPVFAEPDATASVESVVSEITDGSDADVESDGYIYHYSDTSTQLGSKTIGVIIWVVCGVLLFGCLCILIHKIIQYRNSR